MSDLYTVYNSYGIGPIFRVTDGGEFHGTVFQFVDVDFEEKDGEMHVNFSTRTVGWRSDKSEIVYVDDFSPEFYERLNSSDYDELCGRILDVCLKQEIKLLQAQKDAE